MKANRGSKKEKTITGKVKSNSIESDTDDDYDSLDEADEDVNDQECENDNAVIDVLFSSSS